MGEKLLTKNEVAEYLHLCPDTIDRLIKRQDITAYKIGNKWMFYFKDVQAYIEKQKQPARDVLIRSSRCKPKPLIPEDSDHYIPGMRVV